MTIVDVTKDNECCCSCTHNKRTFDKDYHCTCTCELDGHRIGYVANFGSVCEEWGRSELTKTGRHFDIQKILEAMKHD